MPEPTLIIDDDPSFRSEGANGRGDFRYGIYHAEDV